MENIGHIGSFYFGSDYTNSEVIIDDIPIIEITTVENITPDISVTIREIPEVTVSVPEISEGFAYGVKCIDLDFTAIPRVGTSPLVVDFEATKKLSNSCKGLKLQRLVWYFDYDNNPENEDFIEEVDYIEDPRLTTTFTYCGILNEKFSVKLKAIFE
ncbi:MAG: hypothetical protein ACOCZ5_01235 [bacterium]